MGAETMQGDYDQRSATTTYSRLCRKEAGISSEKLSFALLSLKQDLHLVGWISSGICASTEARNSYLAPHLK